MNKPSKKGFKAPTVDSNSSDAVSLHLTADDFVMAAGNQSENPNSEVTEDTPSYTDYPDYITALIQKGDINAIMADLKQLAHVKAIVNLARDTGIDFEVLNQTLSGTRDLEFSIALKIIRALGLKLIAIEA